MHSVFCVFSFMYGALWVGVSIHGVPFISQGEIRETHEMVKVFCRDPSASVCPTRKRCFNPLQTAFLISIDRCLFQWEWLNKGPHGQALLWGLPFFLKPVWIGRSLPIKMFSGLKKRIDWLVPGKSGLSFICQLFYLLRQEISNLH